MFRTLTDTVLVAPQITVDQIAEAKAQGVTLIVNNRPEGEAQDQTPGPVIEAVARDAGIEYVAIPVDHSGFSAPQVEAMMLALDATEGKVLAYCRSGTRSTLLWALAQTAGGHDPETLSETAADAGYDLSPIRPMMDSLRGRRG